MEVKYLKILNNLSRLPFVLLAFIGLYQLAKSNYSKTQKKYIFWVKLFFILFILSMPFIIVFLIKPVK